ncbi:FAD binding domain-containing protein [Paraburkholderia solisilvae]|uniref:6-hydroxypseudooxynicotine dehydrogenase complex subunit alpha n=1 Tax=Paraburkholderia solisilvae TaxID=624376 RepID=A0A6J5D169_9BURK|nr:xanthine dehydrogenase family protein subunit M [Paraburkholderia solisilvae]CAB3747969.1 6-hydroxypseudooxynicotine dehydrogenase complex subunit alpha [Paraburkholderia solisilvae]
MKPSEFQYHAPTTVDEAVQLLGTLEDARLLAGGQSLMPMMNFRYLMTSHIIDLNGVEALTGIEERNGRVHIGAMARQRDIELSPLVTRRAPLVREAYQLVSHKQIRNRGTLGGSLCQLDPSSEQPCFTAALDGVLTIARYDDGAVATRELPMSDWALMYMTPALEEGDLLVDISLDIWPEGHGYAFEEFARRHGDYAIVGVAALCTADAQGRLDRVSLTICGVAPGPVRMHEVEAALRGQPMDEGALRVASDAARALDVMTDAHVSTDYRQHLAGVLTERALKTAFSRVARQS